MKTDIRNTYQKAFTPFEVVFTIEDKHDLKDFMAVFEDTEEWFGGAEAMSVYERLKNTMKEAE